MAKLLCSQIAQKAASSACNWLGGMGFVHGKASKHYRDAKIGEIYEGISFSGFCPPGLILCHRNHQHAASDDCQALAEGLDDPAFHDLA